MIHPYVKCTTWNTVIAWRDYSQLGQLSIVLISNNMDRASLSRDISSLVALDRSVLSDTSTKSAALVPDAVTALDTISIGKSTPDESQVLTKAYIKAMRHDVMSIKDEESEIIGTKLDTLRGKAEGMTEALGEVRV